MAEDDSPSDPRKPAWRDALALFGLFGAALVLWEWNVLRAGSTLFSLANFDLYSEFYPRHDYAGRVLATGAVPLWDPHQIGGLPFLATWQGGVLYPPNWLYALLPTATAMGIIGLLHVFLAGAFSYCLCREFGRSRAAAGLAGLVFMGGGATLFMNFHTNAINSAAWLPAALYCCARLGREANLRWSVLLAACIALQFLAGREYTFVMTVHCVGLFVLFQAVWLWRDGRGREELFPHLARVAVAAVLAGGFVAAQALPTLALAEQGGRTLAGLAGDRLEIYNPMSPGFFLANLLNPGPGAIRREYFGWVPLVCFVLGFRLAGRDRPVVFASVLSVLSLLLCFGSATPLYDVYRVLPLGSSFRLPDRFVYLFAFGLALVAAAGFDRVLDADGDRRGRLRALAPRFAVLVVIGFALPFVVRSEFIADGITAAAEPWRWFAFYGFPKHQFASIVLAPLCFIAALALIAATAWRSGKVGGHALAAAVLAAAAVDLGLAQQNRFLHPASTPEPGLAAGACYARVRELAGPLGRHLAFRIPNSYALKDKDGELFGRHSASHYDPLVTNRHAAYFDALQAGGVPFSNSPWNDRSLFMGFLSGTPAPDRMRLLDLMGTKILLADGRPGMRPAPLDALLAGYPRAGRCTVAGAEGPIPVDLYSNRNALPRAVLVHRVHTASDNEAAIRRVLQPDFDAASEVVIEGPAPAVETGRGSPHERAEIRLYTPDRVEVVVDTDAPGVLVLADTWDADWVARVDGVEVTILPANGLFRAVAVPRGRSEVAFDYEPTRFRAGAAISITSVAGACLLWIRAAPSRRKSRSRR